MIGERALPPGARLVTVGQVMRHPDRWDLVLTDDMAFDTDQPLRLGRSHTSPADTFSQWSTSRSSLAQAPSGLLLIAVPRTGQRRVAVPPSRTFRPDS